MYRIYRSELPRGHCPLGTPTPSQPFHPGSNPGGAFGEFGGLGPLGGVFPLPPGLLAHLGCTPAIRAQWVAPLTGKKKKLKIEMLFYKYSGT